MAAAVATASAPQNVQDLHQDPEEMTLRLERVGGRLAELSRDGPGRKIATPLMECVQELRVVWGALREFALVFDANRAEQMLAHEAELRQAMAILDGTVGDLSKANERTVAVVDEQIHELDDLGSIGDTSLLTGRIRGVTEGMRGAAEEMKQDIQKSVAELDSSEKIIHAVDEKLREAHKQIMYDALTRLLSRTVLLQRINETAAQPSAIAGSWCLAVIEINDLKTVNRQFSRRVGDALLFRVAEIVQGTCESAPGSIAGRWGGTEFGILMPRTPLREGRQLVDEIRGAVALAKWECKAADQRTVLATTVSIGIVEHRKDEPASTLIQRAEACLEQATRKGNNTLVAEG